MRLAAVIITKDEETRIRRCLDALRGWVDEIVLVDDASADATVRIAREEYGAKVIPNAHPGAFDQQRNQGLEAADADWILQLDADEVVPPETAVKIREALEAHPDHAAFQILRRDCVFDRPLTYKGSCFQTRILRKGRAINQGAVHEEAVVDGPVGTVDARILHYNLDSVGREISKNNHYTDLECDLYLRAHAQVSWREVRRRILYKTPTLFYKHYIKNKAYKDGPHGFVRAVLNTLHPLMLWLKILERAVKEDRLTF